MVAGANGPAGARAAGMQQQGAGNAVQVFHLGGRDTQLYPLPDRVCISKKLELGVEAGVKLRLYRT